MNFTTMPELSLQGAYPAALTMMGLMIAGTLFYFYRRGWLMRAPIENPIQTPETESNKPRRAVRRVVVPSATSHPKQNAA